MSNFTETVILKTFGEMLDRMPFEKITVSAIIKTCGISRNTFYYHYQDIYDLLDHWLEKEFELYRDVEVGNWKENTKGFLRNCQGKRRQVYHLFNSLSRDRIEHYIFSASDTVFAQYVKQAASDREISPRRMKEISDICCYAILGFFLRFLWNGMKDDIDSAVDELGDLFESFVRNALKEFEGM